MYYFYIIIFLLLNIWLLNKITSNFNTILLKKKIDKSHPIMFNVLTKNYKKERKKTGLSKIRELIQTNIKHVI